MELLELFGNGSACDLRNVEMRNMNIFVRKSDPQDVHNLWLSQNCSVFSSNASSVGGVGVGGSPLKPFGNTQHGVHISGQAFHCLFFDFQMNATFWLK